MNTQEKIIWKFCQPSILRANDHPDFYRREPLRWGVDEAMNGKSRHLDIHEGTSTVSEEICAVTWIWRITPPCGVEGWKGTAGLAVFGPTGIFSRSHCTNWLRETSLEKIAWGQGPSPECPGQSLEQHGREAPSEESQVVGKWNGHLYGSNG
uniref:Uncharacterized protein n=1 Tax=Coccidioides posadasii RMSCC 3488 TaxID=454284 RepID=A0A0J6FH05_COCPO|nr:hypothetical protein CPAG_04926 [Coccidioides posadasii RMSCC 3488]